MGINTLFLTKLVLILCWLYFGTALAKNKYNVSMLEMATCKEYDIRGVGYKYADFFYVHSLDNNKISNTERLHLKFFVQTAMDAHVLLAVNTNPRLLDRVYEIVIGAGGNTFSAIRTSMGRRRVATNQDERLLSVLDPTPIEIIQQKDGNLLVYITGYSDAPLMNFTDASPLDINYVSFSSFGSVHARWFYDCKFEDGFATEIEEEVRVLPPRQQLIANLTNWAENASLPMNLSYVNVMLQIRAVSYEQHTSILKTRIDLMMNWQDRRLQWDPSEFSGIDALRGRDFEIWSPTLVVVNGAYRSIGNLKLTSDLVVHDHGMVELIAEDVELTTFCLNSNRNWPHELIDCELTLGLNEFSMQNGVHQLVLNYTNLKPMQTHELTDYSEWALESVAISRYENGSMARLAPKGKIQIMSGDIAVDLQISRNSEFYKSVFSMPILTGHSLIIISFLLRGYRRGAVTLVVFAVLSLGLMFLTKHAAPAYVPNIMYAYQLNMCVSVYCYLLHIAIMWLEMFPPKSKPSGCGMAIVNSSPLRFMLCMRFADSTEFAKIQEYPWREIAKMLNSVNCLIVIVIFMVVNVILLPHM